MSETLNKNFDFTVEYNNKPDQIVEKICEELSKSTKDYAKIGISVYNGSVVSYDRLSIGKMLSSLTTTKVDIQTELGTISKGNFKYEVTITAPYIESFKYRPFFVQYGIGGYPVRIILEQGIADEIFEQEDAAYIVSCNDEEELEKLTLKIFNSEKIHELLQGIISETRRQLNIISEQ